MTVHEKIRSHYKAGNINQFIREILNEFKSLLGLRKDLILQINNLCNEYHQKISPKTIKCMEDFIKGPYSEDAKKYEIGNSLFKLKSEPGDCTFKIGQSCFPAIATEGSVYDIQIYKAGGVDKKISKNDSDLLDINGSVLVSILKRVTNKSFLWEPDNYKFIILDNYGKETDSVQGLSMGIPLFLSLYSHLIQKPVPFDLSSTGIIKRDGNVLPVEEIEKKLSAIHHERNYIQRIMISEQQNLPSDCPPFQFIRVKNAYEIIEKSFGNLTDSSIFNLHEDIPKAIEVIDNQYYQYLIDTCVENAQTLIQSLEQAMKIKKQKSTRNVEYLFKCYWRLGACFCHKGDIKGTDKFLKKAKELFDKYPGQIEYKYYFECQNQQAVLFKDIFQYDKAEKIHKRLIEEMSTQKISERGKNYSSLSQLYLAKKEYKKAIKYQKKAIEMTPQEDAIRNWNYLAQIFTRMGKFKEAGEKIESIKKNMIYLSVGLKKAQSFFSDCVEAEYLYRRLTSLKRKPSSYKHKAEEIIGHYQSVTQWTEGLIYKYCGLVMMANGQAQKGLKCLEVSIEYFNTQTNPILLLLGVTVRIEKMIFLFDSEKIEFKKKDINKIIEDLSAQKDIKSFFLNAVKDLNRFLKYGKSNSNESDRLMIVLSNINKEIPY